MKTDFKPVMVLTVLSTLLIFSCESYEKEADDAFDEIKKKKMMSKGLDPITEEVIPKATKTVWVQKAIAPNPKQQFRTEIEATILSNENKINSLKALPNNNSKMEKRIASLEEKNAKLRLQFAAYEQDEKTRWESFKNKVTVDLKQIDSDLNELTPKEPKLP